MTEERERKPGSEDPEEQGGEPISRRELLARSGRYSLAVLGVAFGGRALSGCSDEDGYRCDNTCPTSFDNECDDGGHDSLYNVCGYGTDCNDCGVRSTTSRMHTGYSDTYSNGYSDTYSNGYSDGYSNAYSDYSDTYYNYYSDYYSDYYNYSDYYYNYYSNYYSNSW